MSSVQFAAYTFEELLLGAEGRAMLEAGASMTQVRILLAGEQDVQRTSQIMAAVALAWARPHLIAIGHEAPTHKIDKRTISHLTSIQRQALLAVQGERNFSDLMFKSRLNLASSNIPHGMSKKLKQIFKGVLTLQECSKLKDLFTLLMYFSPVFDEIECIENLRLALEPLWLEALNREVITGELPFNVIR